MKQYLDLMRDIKIKGVHKGDRTGTGTQSVFGRQLRFNLADGFPLVTTKKVHLKSVIVELLWFLNGDTNIRYLNENGCRIWDEWALTEEDSSKLSTIPIPTKTMQWVWESIKVKETEKITEVNKIWQEHGEAKVREYLINEGISGFYSYEMADCRKGDLGPVYGKQWRSWACPDGTTIDQISEVIQLLKTKPDSRRLIVSAWNPADLPDETISPQANVLNGKMALAACHTLFQFYSEEITAAERLEWMRKNNMSLYEDYQSSDVFPKTVAEDLHEWLSENGVPARKLSCQLYQRSADVFLGVPFNIASYALLTMMIAQQCNMAYGDFVHTFGDVHIYSNLREQVDEQLSREPKSLPTLKLINKPKDIFSYTLDDFELEGYDPHPAIKGKVAV